MHRPRLEVLGWDERGTPRLLEQAEAGPGRPVSASSAARRDMDSAGYVHTLYEAAYACPWGTALVLCRRAQEGFWHNGRIPRDEPSRGRAGIAS